MKRMPKLVLLRHGESDWNRENRFTGWTDVDLSLQGIAEARAAGKLLKAERYAFDMAYTSVLKRAIRTLWIALDELGQNYRRKGADGGGPEHLTQLCPRCKRVVRGQAYFAANGGGFYGVGRGVDVTGPCPDCLLYNQTYTTSIASTPPAQTSAT